MVDEVEFHRSVWASLRGPPQPLPTPQHDFLLGTHPNPTRSEALWVEQTFAF